MGDVFLWPINDGVMLVRNILQQKMISTTIPQPAIV